MSSGNTRSFLPQRFWQHVNSMTPKSKPWEIECAISDAIRKAEHILGKRLMSGGRRGPQAKVRMVCSKVVQDFVGKVP